MRVNMLKTISSITHFQSQSTQAPTIKIDSIYRQTCREE